MTPCRCCRRPRPGSTAAAEPAGRPSRRRRWPSCVAAPVSPPSLAGLGGVLIGSASTTTTTQRRTAGSHRAGGRADGIDAEVRCRCAGRRRRRAVGRHDQRRPARRAGSVGTGRRRVRRRRDPDQRPRRRRRHRDPRPPARRDRADRAPTWSPPTPATTSPCCAIDRDDLMPVTFAPTDRGRPRRRGRWPSASPSTSTASRPSPSASSRRSTARSSPRAAGRSTG